ncbi:MAG: DUF697 domain-containing protein [Chloroflexota bacterium]
MNEQELVLIDQYARQCIKGHAGALAYKGTQNPSLIFDEAEVIVRHWLMLLAQLASLYQVDVSEETLYLMVQEIFRSLIVYLSGAGVILALGKMFGLGNVVSRGISGVIYGAMTIALGEAYQTAFRDNIEINVENVIVQMKSATRNPHNYHYDD